MFEGNEYLEAVEYKVQIGDYEVEKVAIYNSNKLNYDTVVACIETDSYNRYMLTLTKEHFNSLFLDEKLPEEGTYEA